MRRNVNWLLGRFCVLLIPLSAGLVLYDAVSRHQVEAFWNQTPGAVMLYGRAPDEKYRLAYAAAAAAARSHGFRFTEPRLVQTNALFDVWYFRRQESSVIAVTRDGGTLIIDGLWMIKKFADEDLECIFAHEVGHIIDFQRWSEDHPIIRRTSCLSTQQRADSIGRVLCGTERYNRVLRRYVKTRPLVSGVCDDTTPVQ